MYETQRLRITFDQAIVRFVNYRVGSIQRSPGMIFDGTEMYFSFIFRILFRSHSTMANKLEANLMDK